MKEHKERAHSKFSASGSERWLNCAASVELEEQCPPSEDNEWSLEGTHAHEVLEAILKNDFQEFINRSENSPEEMLEYIYKTVDRIHWIKSRHPGSVLEIEGKIYNKTIHPEMFGTCDTVIYAVNEHLHIIDFKYGKGHIVSAEKNTQLIQYALAAAEKYEWKFKKVTMHILQPRAGGNWHKDWVITREELQNKWYLIFKRGVARVLKGGNKPFEGNWCYWCRAKNICPAKIDKRVNEAKEIFKNSPIGKEENGIKKEGKKETFFAYESESQESFEFEDEAYF